MALAGSGIGRAGTNPTSNSSRASANRGRLPGRSVVSQVGRESHAGGMNYGATLYASRFAQPSGLATDGKFLYVADSEVSAIRKLSTDGKVMKRLPIDLQLAANQLHIGFAR